MTGMIDISNKPDVKRTAMASGRIGLKPSTILAIQDGNIKKGDCLEVAKAAAIMAVKSTPADIVHCHPLPVEKVEVDFQLNEGSIEVEVTVKATYKTGVEMEALNGVTRALLTIWDMTKYLEKDENGQYLDTRITDIIVTKKIKG